MGIRAARYLFTTVCILMLMREPENEIQNLMSTGCPPVNSGFKVCLLFDQKMGLEWRFSAMITQVRQVPENN